MRTLHFGTTTANVDHVVKLEVIHVRDNTRKIIISFSDGTIKEIFPGKNIDAGELADRLIQLFKDPEAAEIYLQEVTAQMSEG